MPHAAPDPLLSLQQQARPLASQPGHTATALPELWLFRSDQPLSLVRGYSPYSQVAVALSGRKWIHCQRQTFLNDARQHVVLHGRHHYQAEVEASPAAPYIALKLQLPPALLGRTLLELLEDQLLPRREVAAAAFVGEVNAPLADALCRLLDCLGHPAERRLLAPLYLKEITVRLLTSEAASVLRAGLTREHLQVLRAMQYIERHATRQPEIDEIASAVAMSRSSLGHRFRQIVGMPPGQYARQLRLETARLLLLDEQVSVAQAAEQAGYASTSHFSRDFRRQVGLSPGRYADTFLRQAVLPLAAMAG